MCGRYRCRYHRESERQRCRRPIGHRCCRPRPKQCRRPSRPARSARRKQSWGR